MDSIYISLFLDTREMDFFSISALPYSIINLIFTARIFVLLFIGMGGRTEGFEGLEKR